MNALLIFLLLVIPFYLQLWLLVAKEENTNPTNSTSPISVVIPFRNERDNLEILKNCIDSLVLIAGDEIIFVDDQSSDEGFDLLNNLRSECRLVTIPPGKQGSKKEALKLGINLAKNEWILSLDADCTMSSEWINAWRTEIRDNRDFIAGQVALSSATNSMLELFNSAEQLTLQTLSKSSINRKTPMLCSGANLMFRKSIWESTGAYKSHLYVSSGDDVLFMKDVASIGGNIDFANNTNCTVSTVSISSFKEWLQQRLRWMSKTSHIAGINSRFHGILLVAWLFVIPIGLLVYGWIYLLIFIPESLVLRIASPFKPKLSNYLFWPFFRIIYPFLVLLLFVASFFVKLKWKDRAITIEV